MFMQFCNFTGKFTAKIKTLLQLLLTEVGLSLI